MPRLQMVQNSELDYQSQRLQRPIHLDEDAITSLSPAIVSAANELSSGRLIFPLKMYYASRRDFTQDSRERRRSSTYSRIPHMTSQAEYRGDRDRSSSNVWLSSLDP
jgi:hypothetical protein